MGAAPKIDSDQGIERQLLAIFAAALAVIWALVGWQTRQSEADAIQSAENRVSDLALAFAEYTNTVIQDTDHVLGELRQYALGSRAEMQGEIQKHQILLAGITHQVGVIDAKGRLIFTNLDPFLKPVDLSDREHFKVFRDDSRDRLFISRPVKGRVSGKWSIQIARPILEGGQMRGVIVVSLDPTSLVRFREKIHLGSEGLVSVVRDSGEIMARNIGLEKYIGQVVKTQPFAQPDSPLQGTYRRHSQADQVERIHGYMRLPEYGVTAIVGAAVAEALAPVRARNVTLLAVTGALTIALGVMAWLSQRKTKLQEELRLERLERQKIME
ncbi:MAG: hypothetical protein IT565_08000, partial [Rhodospirillales bacterium]|nr:hypothetical protein [Rhodospirillales bacterium]